MKKKKLEKQARLLRAERNLQQEVISRMHTEIQHLKDGKYVDFMVFQKAKEIFKFRVEFIKEGDADSTGRHFARKMGMYIFTDMGDSFFVDMETERENDALPGDEGDDELDHLMGPDDEGSEAQE